MLGSALREKASLAATNELWAIEKGEAPQHSGRRSRRAAAPTPLIKVVEQEWAEREREMKKQHEQELKELADKQQSEIAAFSEKYLQQLDVFAVQAMWEIPSMGVLLYLLQEPLRIVDFTLTALEIGILQPQWSVTLASIFVGLLTPAKVLSSRKEKDKELREKSLEYDEWHQLLAERLDQWYEYRELVFTLNEVCSPKFTVALSHSSLHVSHIPCCWKTRQAAAAPVPEERATTGDGYEPFNANELPEPGTFSQTYGRRVALILAC